MEEQREWEAQDHPVGQVYVACAYLGSRKAEKLIADIRRPLKKKNKVGLALSEQETMIRLYLDDSYCTPSQWRLLLGPLGSPIGHAQMPGHLQSSGMPQTCHGDQVWAMGREWESCGGEGGFRPSKANTPPFQTHQISTPSYPAVRSSNYGHSSSSHCPGPFSPSSPVLGSHCCTIGSPHRHPYPQSLPHQSCSPGGCQGPSKYTP